MWQHMKAHGILPYSLVIGQRLMQRYTQQKPSSPLQEKPPARRVHSGRRSQDQGVIVSQDAQHHQRPSIAVARHGDRHEHGTAPKAETLWMGERPSSLPTQLRLFNE